jgi:hypothetical protein
MNTSYLSDHYSSETLTMPISQGSLTIYSDEYIEKEDFEAYFPITFNICSILIDRVERFNNVASNDWSSAGFKLPDEMTFNNVKLFLTMIPEDYLYSLLPDNIEPTPYGTFVLDFEKNDKLLSIEIGKDKIGFYTKFNNEVKDTLDGDKFDGNEIPGEVWTVFEKFVS